MLLLDAGPAGRVLQDECGAKSVKCLAELACACRASFSVLFSEHQFKASTFFVGWLQKEEHLTA